MVPQPSTWTTGDDSFAHFRIGDALIRLRDFLQETISVNVSPRSLSPVGHGPLRLFWTARGQSFGLCHRIPLCEMVGTEVQARVIPNGARGTLAHSLVRRGWVQQTSRMST